jgi:hypothetical protein
VNTIEQRKTQAIESLSSQFSQNNLSIEEYERLVDYINRAESDRELCIIEKMIVDNALLSADYPESPYQNRQDGLPLHGTENDNWSAGAITVLSNRLTSGRTLQRQQSFVTLMGNHTISISAEDLPPGRTIIDIVNIMGNTTIFVDTGITVHIAANPILGTVTVGRGIDSQSRLGKPELLITGIALCGSISVQLKRNRVPRQIY